jgi:NADP-dependent 3-hydroxy acid dehydrogenase YdfG
VNGLRGAVVTVTGASAGIGRTTAWAFAARGATVVVAARRIDRLEALTSEIAARGGTASAVACDVSDRASVDALYERVLELHGRCDVLVNNAGVPGGGDFLALPIERIEEVVRTNFLGVVYGCRTFLPEMVERGSGHVVNVASMAGRFAVPGSAVYSATKHAVVAFSEALFYDLRDRGVVVTAVNPALVATERFPHDDANPRLVMPPERIANTIVDVVRRGKGPEVSVPRALAAAQAVRVLAPPLYRYGMTRVARTAVRPTRARGAGDAPRTEDA